MSSHEKMIEVFKIEGLHYLLDSGASFWSLVSHLKRVKQCTLWGELESCLGDHTRLHLYGQIVDKIYDSYMVNPFSFTTCNEDNQ